MKRAVVFGASGWVGSHLLRQLLESSNYQQVTAVRRNDGGMTHPKLKTLIADYHSLASVTAEIAADEIFISLGTTRKNSPDRAEYYQVDHDYPVLAARISKEHGAKSVFLVTAVGADPDSKLFYVRTKGETERDIIALQFEHTHIFRPSMILGARKENRSLSGTVLIQGWSAINPLLTLSASKYTGITGQELARAMRESANHPSPALSIYHWKQMHALLQRT